MEKKGVWWAAISKEMWPTEDERFMVQIAKEFDSVVVDRKQELVFIGCDPLDTKGLRSKLDACLLDTDMFELEKWASLKDPLPEWNDEEHDHDHDHAREGW